jgi:phosphocarrier protein
MGESLIETIEITNRRGLHVRASAKFVNLAGQFDATVTVVKDGVEVCGTSIMGLMMLAAERGSTIRIETRGRQARAALDALVALVEAGFDEEK